AEAVSTANAVLWTPAENYGIPGLDISNGNGAQWCVEVWRLNRGATVPPWTVIEAFGYYGETSPKAVGTLPPGQGFVQPGCQFQGNNRMIYSHITVHLEAPPTTGSGGTNAPAGPAGGTSAVGAR